MPRAVLIRSLLGMYSDVSVGISRTFNDKELDELGAVKHAIADAILHLTVGAENEPKDSH